MKHNTHSRARNKSAWVYGSIKPASPELIEAALRDSPMLRESLDEANSCAQIEYDKQQYENESMGNPATL